MERSAGAWQRLLPRLVVPLAAAVPAWWLVSRILAGLYAWLTFTIMFYVAIPAVIVLLVMAWFVRARAGVVAPRAAGPVSAWSYAAFLVFALTWPFFFGENGMSGPIVPAPARKWFSGLSEAGARTIGSWLVWGCLATGTLSFVASAVELWLIRRVFHRPRGHAEH